jgi:hypothetical protein
MALNYRSIERWLSSASPEQPPIAGLTGICRVALEALEDRSPRPSRVWNRIPKPVREKIKDLALKVSDLLLRESAVLFTDTEKYFVPEASAYRILKSQDLITSPTYVVVSAAVGSTCRPSLMITAGTSSHGSSVRR